MKGGNGWKFTTLFAWYYDTNIDTNTDADTDTNTDTNNDSDTDTETDTCAVINTYINADSDKACLFQISSCLNESKLKMCLLQRLELKWMIT